MKSASENIVVEIADNRAYISVVKNHAGIQAYPAEILLCGNKK